MTKYLPAKALTRADCADYKITSYVETLPPGVEFDDIFNPLFWAHHKGKLKINDIIRLIASDRSFDVDVTVSHVSRGGVTVELRGGRLPRGIDIAEAARQAAMAKAKEPQPVPVNKISGKHMIRIDHTPKTKWRLIGIDGKEVKRGMEKAEAEAELDKYLNEMNMFIPEGSGGDKTGGEGTGTQVSEPVAA
jgi:hypothetical protein